MITVSPSAIPTLIGPSTASREFKPIEYMAPWMFIPAYLEVCYATCSTVFLRSPLVQPKLMEIPSPYPPNWHQLVYEWYASIKRAQTKKPILEPLVLRGQPLKLKPKFDSIMRADLAKKNKLVMVQKQEQRLQEAKEELKKYREANANL
jgi:hypothetical protein